MDADTQTEKRAQSRMLLVEDDPAQSQTLTEIMRMEGFDVYVCDKAADALQQLRHFAFDVMILDLQLSDGDTQTLLQEMSYFFLQIPTVIHTGQGSFESAKMALNLGVFAYLEKGSDVRELVAHAHRALAEKLRRHVRSLEADLAQIFKLAPDMICIVDVEKSGFERVNPAFERVLGYSEEELLACSFWDLIHPDDRERTRGLMEGSLQQGTPVTDCEIRYRCKDGSFRWLNWMVQPKLDTRRAYAVAHDITNRKHLEQERTDLIHNLEEAQRIGCLGSWRWDIQSYDAHWSKTLFDIYGRDPNQGVPPIEEYLDHIHPKDRDRLQQAIDASFKTGCYEIEYRIRRYSDNEERILSASGEVQFDSAGKPIRQVGTVIDVTERRRAEVQIKETEQMYQLLLENAGLGVGYYDLKGTCLLMNRVACQAMQCQSQELIGRHCKDIYGNEIGQRVLDRFAQVQNREVALHFEDEVEMPCGEKWYDSTYTCIRDDTGHVAGIQIISKEITERKQIELQLATSEEKYRAVVENIQEGILIIQDEAPQYCNQRWLEITGYSRDEFENLPFLSMVNPVDLKAVEAAYQGLTSGKPFPKSIEFRLLTKPGQTRWLSCKNSRIDWQGRPAAMCLLEDTTDQRRNQRALVESEGRYRNLIQTAYDAIYMISGEGAIAGANPAAARMLDRSIDEMEALSLNDIDPNFSVQAFLAFWENQPEGEAKLFETTHQRKDGSIFPVEVSGTRFSLHGKAYYYGIARDITERKAAEEAMARSEAKFRALFEQAGGYCMILDPNTSDGIPIILDANRAACQAHGYTREEFIGRPVADIDDEDGKRLVRERTSEIMAGKPFYVENTHVRKDGTTFPVAVNARRIDIEDKSPLIYTIEYDITDRKQFEASLLHYQQKLKSLTAKLTVAEERLKSELAVRLHDDICQDLVMLRVEIGMLGKSSSDPGDQDNFKSMYEQAGHIIDKAKNMTLELCYPALSLYGLENAIRTWSEQEIGQKHPLEVQVQDDGKAKPLSEDVKHVLFRCVRELLFNVVKHSQASEVCIQITREEDRIALMVKDNGTGLTETVEASTLGGGFGILSISEALQGLGGNLTITSEPAQGCTAKVVAPLALQDASTKKEGARA